MNVSRCNCINNSTRTIHHWWEFSIELSFVERQDALSIDALANVFFTSMFPFYTPTTSASFLNSYTIESNHDMRVHHRFTRELLKSSIIGSKRSHLCQPFFPRVENVESSFQGRWTFAHREGVLLEGASQDECFQEELNSRGTSGLWNTATYGPRRLILIQRLEKGKSNININVPMHEQK